MKKPSKKAIKAAIRKKKAISKATKKQKAKALDKANFNRHNPNVKKTIKVRKARRSGPYPRYFNHKLRLTYLISRRCLGRVFRLPPNDPTRKLFEYFLAYAAKRYKIAINAVVIMSNHYHLVVSVTRWNSNISGFMRCLNHNTSKILNRRQGRRGPLYEVKPFNIKPLATKEDILRAMAYTTLNPVKAGLVEDPGHWPGLISTFQDYNNPREIVERPDFFGPASDKPTEMRLEFVPPPAFHNLSIEEFQSLFEEQCNADLAQIHQSREDAGLGYLGVEALQNQSIDDTPNCPDIDRFQLAQEENATSHGFFIPNSQEERDFRAHQDEFRQEHQECFERAKDGERPTFPYATLKMVQTYGFPMKPRNSESATPILHHFPELALE